MQERLGQGSRYKLSNERSVIRKAIWEVFQKVIQSNARFNALNKLTIQIHAVRMHFGSGFAKVKGRRLTVMAHLKKVLYR
jgi:hypothetical protein